MNCQKIASSEKIRVRLLDLKEAEYNPRKKLAPEDPEYQRIARSIEKFGYCDPIIINKDLTIIGGHQRRQVLIDYGYEEADCIQVDLDKQNEKALNIALNKITGEWDEVKLRDLLVDLDLGDFDVTLTGFERSEMNDLIENLSVGQTAEDDDFDLDQAVEDISEPVSKRGDIWILGKHRLMCGDSTDQDDMDALMGGEMADLVVTDPPYNVDYGGKTKFLSESRFGTGQSDIQNDNMDEGSFYEFLLDAFRNADDHMRTGAAIYVFHADAHGLTLRRSFMDAGLKPSECLVWEKNQFVLGRQDYQWRHEPILYGWKEGSGHYFINDRTQDTVLLQEDIDLESMKKPELIAYIEEMRRKYKDQTTVLFDNKPARNDVHPTMKPVSLIGRLITNSSKAGWNVLDLFGGSGSTLIASEQLGRSAFLMELDEKFCDVIVKRWEEYTGEKAVLLE